MSRIQFTHGYDDIISLENLLGAWKEFVRGKSKREDVAKFQLRLMDNLLSLHDDLKNKTFRHGPYKMFKINDPKPRDIHKATVRDRVLHRAIYRKLYPFFDKTFISDSYSCRLNKGTHKAMDRFRDFADIVSKNNSKTAWVLKYDIRKFFASIDHSTLLNILVKYIPDKNTIWLLNQIIPSFHSTNENIGIPLGNLTSQLFANIYMNEFDLFMKHKVKAKHYIRYADDFVIFDTDRNRLRSILNEVNNFLNTRLYLSLHPNKIILKTAASGVDFLGWIHFPDHRILRTTTKRRMLKKCSGKPKLETVSSYLGMLIHGNTYEYKQLLQPLHDELFKEYLNTTIF